MSTSAPIDGKGFHVVVADDGSLPAAELARLGVRPGAHLRLLVDEQDRPKRKTMSATTESPTRGVRWALLPERCRPRR